jgi:hypothetical protein
MMNKYEHLEQYNPNINKQNGSAAVVDLGKQVCGAASRPDPRLPLKER